MTKEILNELSDTITNIEKYVEEVEKSGDILKVCTAFQHLKTWYEQLDFQRKRAYALKDKLDKQIVPSVIENSGMDKVRIPELSRSFYIVTKYSASIKDKEKGFDWLRKNEAGDLITETVNAGTLSAFLRDYQIEQGFDVPEDIFKFSSYNTTGSSKYTPKNK